MGYETIHETVIRDIADFIKDGIDVSRDAIGSAKGAGYASSITNATKGLVMEFPVLVSKANHIESAGIVAKAYEAKFVTLLHMAFVASNITNSKEGLDYIKNFHTNLDSGKLSVDDFIDVMDSFVESSTTITADSYAKFKAVTADMRNLCYCFGEDINESSLNDYKVMNNYGSLKVVKEAKDDGDDNSYTADEKFDWTFNQNERKIDLDKEKFTYQRQHDYLKDLKDIEKFDYQKQRDVIDDARHQAEFIYRQQKDAAERGDRKAESDYKKQRDKLQDAIDDAERRYKHTQDSIANKREDEKLKLQKNRDARDVNKDQRDKEKHALDMIATSQNLITNHIVSSDLKKANELTPTMMVVNFVYKEDGATEGIWKQMVVGVKAKLYEVEPMDVITKLISKHVDSNLILKLVQVNTRQISFVKDFLFAINDAKLDALSRSRRGSTNKLFKVLERRAIGSRASKSLMMKDYCKAITSLVISQEEAEELLKNNIDVSNPKVIRNIMEQLNLISFAIIDESAEAVKFIFDTGDDIYETIPLSKLEKEQKDGMSKKVINLMAKMNR